MVRARLHPGSQSASMFHLPEAVYDVQATVNPIHRPSLIWALLAPIGLAAVVTFGVSFNYYGGINIIETTVGINFERGPGWKCAMLGLGSDIAGVTIQSIAPDMQMWGVDSSGAGLETGKVTFKFRTCILRTSSSVTHTWTTT